MSSDLRKYKNILSESYNPPVVNEDLGTLKFVDKDLIGALKNKPFYSRRSTGLKSGLTSDSPVKTTLVGTASAIHSLLTDKTVFGAVFMVEDRQLFVAVKEDNDKYNITFSRTNKSYAKDAGIDEYDYSGKVSSAKLKKLVSAINKMAKEDNKMLEAQVIFIDGSKTELRKERQAARSGSPFFTKNLTRELRQSLSARLEKFKASKSTNVDDLDAAFETIKEKFLDMINVGGYSYKLSRTNLNWESLNKGEDDTNVWSDSYLTYSLTSDSEGKRSDEMRKVYTDAREISDDSEKDAYIDAERAKLPPRSFDIILRLKGNVLTPVRLKSSEY
ncbi:hypothetical protein FDI40_gp033 [Agrobacterium phage Atu_ph07]|uniref:Uncharacterized protein n=1 Tax=Agrobacterium phage Atu_ph07 TaxID=2024264 RepID=A0A2L0UZ79_9CAUD|nr:hypothetical protein FDI40_gp033 [Agrobacterium phage Atu_ph07]AUZ94845.1 hypothetical protein [Agrobacterium phage Atu_ph07]